MATNAFIPHPLVKGGNLQTIVGFLAQKQGDFLADEILSDSQSAFEALLNIPKCSSQKTPVVLLFPELGGTANQGHLPNLAKKLVQVGLRTARFHFHHRLHAGSTEDVLNAIGLLADRWPNAPLALTGLGLSGTIILNLLGKEENLLERIPQLLGAMTVCPTLDLTTSRQELTRFRNRYLGKLYCRTQTHYLADSFLDYDRTIVEGDFGFSSFEDYYHRCSPTQVVSQISLPTLVLAAADDPINPVKTVTRAPYSSAVTLKIESSGGHLGFYAKDKTRFGDKHWLDESVVSWWQDILMPKENMNSLSPRRLA